MLLRRSLPRVETRGAAGVTLRSLESTLATWVFVVCSLTTSCAAGTMRRSGTGKTDTDVFELR